MFCALHSRLLLLLFICALFYGANSSQTNQININGNMYRTTSLQRSGSGMVRCERVCWGCVCTIYYIGTYKYANVYHEMEMEKLHVLGKVAACLAVVINTHVRCTRWQTFIHHRHHHNNAYYECIWSSLRHTPHKKAAKFPFGSFMLIVWRTLFHHLSRNLSHVKLFK